MKVRKIRARGKSRNRDWRWKFSIHHQVIEMRPGPVTDHTAWMGRGGLRTERPPVRVELFAIRGPQDDYAD